MTRVLLIDGEAANRLVMHSRLKDVGYHVVAAENGAQGLALAREHNFDLVLVDAALAAGITATDVCRRLKQRPDGGNVPVVLISRSAGRDDALKGYEAGCDAFVSKAETGALDHVLRVLLKYKNQLDAAQSRLRAYEENARRGAVERERAPEVELAANSAGPATSDTALLWREIGSSRPDGLLIVDGEGFVRHADRGAHDLLGSGIEGKHLGLATPHTGLEAFVRDAHSDKNEGFRFDVQGRGGRPRRALSATVVPIVATPGELDPDLRIVLLVDTGRRRVASELMRLQDYTMPRWEAGALRDAARIHFTTMGLIGTSANTARLRGQVGEAARMSEPALIKGEPGTGRQHVARTLHYGGEWGGPFLAVHCAALSPEHLESELFGHVKGASADAVFDRPGLMQHGAHGTVYVEDVELLPPELQAKLLTAINEHAVTRAGAQKPESVEVRIVASTSVDLAAQVAAGKFDGELYDALSAIEIELVPLRERRDDIADLARHFLRLYAGARPRLELSADALARLEVYEWPGNVRELRACIERACRLAKTDLIDVDQLTAALRDTPAELPTRELTPAARGARPSTNGTAKHDASTLEAWQISPDDPVSLDLYEKKCLLRAIAQAGGNKLGAAELLDVGKSTLYRKLKKYGIQ